jgi:hypothetical protein
LRAVNRQRPGRVHRPHPHPQPTTSPPRPQRIPSITTTPTGRIGPSAKDHPMAGPTPWSPTITSAFSDATGSAAFSTSIRSPNQTCPPGIAHVTDPTHPAKHLPSGEGFGTHRAKQQVGERLPEQFYNAATTAVDFPEPGHHRGPRPDIPRIRRPVLGSSPLRRSTGWAVTGRGIGSNSLVEQSATQGVRL